MNDLINLIKTVVTNELSPDVGVKDNSFILMPYMVTEALKGDGKPQEIATRYQLDIFFRKKGELLSKTKSLIEVLNQYPMPQFTITWEENARMWRGTATIEKL